MKIVITKIDRTANNYEAVGEYPKQYWEIEYRVQTSDATWYFVGNHTFMGTLPSEDDMIKTIKESLINILKELL